MHRVVYKPAGLGRGNFSIVGLPEIGLFRSSRSLPATSLPPFSSLLQLPIPLGMDLLLTRACPSALRSRLPAVALQRVLHMKSL
jgi:hypothetical protein